MTKWKTSEYKDLPFEPYRPTKITPDKGFSERDFRNVIAHLFLDSSLYSIVVTGNKNATSGRIHVPKRFIGKRATVIIWNK